MRLNFLVFCALLFINCKELFAFRQFRLEARTWPNSHLRKSPMTNLNILKAEGPPSNFRVSYSTPQNDNKNPNKTFYVALWVLLVSYAYLLSPGGSPEASQVDLQIVKEIILKPFDSTVTPVFSSIFNALGVLPFLYGSLLIPGSSNQKVPALPFIISSFALGFFGLGPYLALREIATEIPANNRPRGTAFFCSRIAASFALAFSLYLGYFSFAGSFNGDRFAAYIDLFQKQRLVHVSSIDFAILSLAIIDPLREDMKRRKWVGASAISFCLVPVLGPALYALIRPSIPSQAVDDA